MKVDLKHLFGLIKAIVRVIIVFTLLTSAITLGYYYYDLSRSPYTKVYNKDKLIYEGKAYYYNTESMGNATLLKIYEKTPWFPRQTQEVLSDEIHIKTVKEPN